MTTSALFALPLLVPSLMSISEQYIKIKDYIYQTMLNCPIKDAILNLFYGTCCNSLCKNNP